MSEVFPAESETGLAAVRTMAVVTDVLSEAGGTVSEGTSAWLMLEAGADSDLGGRRIFVSMRVLASEGGVRNEAVTIGALTPARDAEPARRIIDEHHPVLVELERELEHLGRGGSVCALGAEIRLTRVTDPEGGVTIAAYRQITLNAVDGDGVLVRTGRLEEAPTAATLRRVANALKTGCVITVRA